MVSKTHSGHVESCSFIFITSQSEYIAPLKKWLTADKKNINLGQFLTLDLHLPQMDSVFNWPQSVSISGGNAKRQA